jgi:hypothetical protein
MILYPSLGEVNALLLIFNRFQQKEYIIQYTIPTNALHKPLNVRIKSHSVKVACRDLLKGLLIFKGLAARRLYKSFGVKLLTYIL